MSIIKRVAIAVAVVAVVEIGFQIWNNKVTAKRIKSVEELHAKFCKLANEVEDDDQEGQELISSFHAAYKKFTQDPSWVNELNLSGIVAVLDIPHQPHHVHQPR